MIVRPEVENDFESIRELTVSAFTQSPLGYSGEGELIDRIRVACCDGISLVADEGGCVVGHVLLSPATLRGAGGVVIGMGLGPMAVRPQRQGEGIGALLVREAIVVLQQLGTPFLVVLGHPTYYTRFGFERASALGFFCGYPDVPDDAFMILVLDESMRSRLGGVVRYHDAFDDAM